MFFVYGLDQLEIVAKLVAQAFWAVSHHIQIAALHRTIERERRNHENSTDLHRVTRSVCIRSSARRPREKVKHRAVMPDVIRRLWKLNSRDV